MASYSGDANNQPSTSSAVSITVVEPDFTLTTNPASATIKAGQTASFAISMTSVGGYSGTVKLSCGSLPAEATCNFLSRHAHRIGHLGKQHPHDHHHGAHSDARAS